MAVIAPTVTAFDPHEYREQMERLQSFAERVHIDLMDGIFAPSKSPGLEQVWWPENITADIHLMYQRPMEQLDWLIKLKPSLVIIHAEADVDFTEFAAALHAEDIRAGLALLPQTTVGPVEDKLQDYDHALVFSGNLGYHGGKADLSLLDKVRQLRDLNDNLEIAWDGGIDDQNAQQLVEAGVQVLNTGGFIANAPDSRQAYETIAKAVA